MKLDFFKDLGNNLNNGKVNQFMNELSEYLYNFSEGIINKQEINIKEISNIDKEDRADKFREEDCLYYVVEGKIDCIYLQNTNTGEVFREDKFSDEMREKICTDEILRYKNGEYVIEEELTQKFFDSFVDIKEFEKIQQDFVRESEIEEFDSNMKYRILSRGEDENYTILYYENDKTNTIKVPNALVPFGADENKVLYYDHDEGKFEIDYGASM